MLAQPAKDDRTFRVGLAQRKVRSLTMGGQRVDLVAQHCDVVVAAIVGQLVDQSRVEHLAGGIGRAVEHQDLVGMGRLCHGPIERVQRKRKAIVRGRRDPQHLLSQQERLRPIAHPGWRGQQHIRIHGHQRSKESGLAAWSRR